MKRNNIIVKNLRENTKIGHSNEYQKKQLQTLDYSPRTYRKQTYSKYKERYGL